MQYVLQHGVQGERVGDAKGGDDIEVQGVSAKMQQSVVQDDQDKILHYEDEVDIVSRYHKMLYRVIMIRYCIGG